MRTPFKRVIGDRRTDVVRSAHARARIASTAALAAAERVDAKISEVKYARAAIRVKHPPTLGANATQNVVRVVTQDQAFDLREPIDLEVGRDGAFHVVEYRPLHLLGHGRTIEQALHNFAIDFSGVWQGIAQAPTRQLSPEARDVKRRMLRLIRSVEERPRD